MDSPDEGGSGHSDLSTGERFARFVKRNALLTVALFSSSLVTAVSTLVTAVITLNNSRSDWHPAEYRKLRELHAGYSIEKFRENLGVPAFRIPFGTGPNDDLPDEGYTKNVFRPRQDYWVEVISDPTGRTVTYSVTSCRADFSALNTRAFGKSGPTRASPAAWSTEPLRFSGANWRSCARNRISVAFRSNRSGGR
ncbi:hypothetical protein [Streptomyces sp. SAS_267]|uniref:hypothetical protein n=1 Tax=Streptomyces sp. SAS_267 TaxID=3412750 RepID=UPI00403CC2DD